MFKSWSVARTFNDDVKRLLSSGGMIGFAYFGVMAVLFNLYLLRLGFDIKFIGLLIAAGQALWGIAALPAGALGHRFGLRTAIVSGYALTAVGMSLLLLVEVLPRVIWAPWIISGWLICWGGGAFFTVNSTPYLMSASSAAERNHVFAAQAAVSALMSFVGSMIGGLLPGFYVAIFGGTLDSPAPYRVVLWLVPLAYLLAVFMMTGAQQIKLESQVSSQFRTGAPIRLFLFLGLIVFLQATGGGAASAFFNIFLDTKLNVPATQIGAIMGIARFLPLAAALVTPQLLEICGTTRTVALVGAVMASSLFALGLSSQWLVAGLSFAVIVSVVAVGGTSSNLFSQELVAEEWRSISAAIITIGLALGWAVSAALGSYLINALGFRGYFFACAALSCLSSVVLLIYLRLQRPQPQLIPTK